MDELNILGEDTLKCRPWAEAAKDYPDLQGLELLKRKQRASIFPTYIFRGLSVVDGSEPVTFSVEVQPELVDWSVAVRAAHEAMAHYRKGRDARNN